MSARVNVRRRTRLPWARTRDTAADPTNAPTLTADPPPPSAAHIRAYHSRIDIGSRYWTLRARGQRGSDTRRAPSPPRSEEHTSELQSRLHLVCRLLLEKKKNEPHTSVT